MSTGPWNKDDDPAKYKTPAEPLKPAPDWLYRTAPERAPPKPEE